MTWLTSPADPKMATTITQTPTANFTSLLTSANLLQHPPEVQLGPSGRQRTILYRA